MLKNEKITNTKLLEKPEPALENKKPSEKSKYSFQEELKNLQKNKEKELNLKEENQDLETDLSQLLFSGNLPYFFNLTEFKPEEKINYQSSFILPNPEENALSPDQEPIVNFDKEKLKVSIEFPNPELSADLQSINIEYDPVSQSIMAEMITSKEAVQILQNQANQLENQLAKHNLKLKSLKISPSQGNEQKQQTQKGKRREQ